jgi:hypothetical protein
MTLSIAVVTNLRYSLINPVQVGEIAAQLKEYAKSLPGSIYVVDKHRKDDLQSEQDGTVLTFPE